MTSTTSRSSSSTGPSRSCRNDDRRARGLRVQPGGRPPPRSAPRQRVPRRLRVRRESAGYGESIGPARDARLRPLGPGEIVQRSLAVGTSPDVLLFWARFTWVGIALVPATLYHLALTYPTKSEWIRRPWALVAIYAPFVFWAYLIVGTGLIIDGISSNAFGPSARVSTAYA